MAEGAAGRGAGEGGGMLWKAGADAFIATARAGASALADDEAVSGDEKDRVWAALCEGLGAVLLPATDTTVATGARGGGEGDGHRQEAMDGEEIDVATIDVLVYELLPLAPSESSQAALLKIVRDASMTVLLLPLGGGYLHSVSVCWCVSVCLCVCARRFDGCAAAAPWWVYICVFVCVRARGG